MDATECPPCLLTTDTYAPPPTTPLIQRYVGKLLLKNEAEELDKVRAAAEDTVSQQFEEIRAFGATRGEPPRGGGGGGGGPAADEGLCDREHAACVSCLGDTKDALKCAESIRAYVSCANRLVQEA